MVTEITHLQTDNWQVALIGAAYNVARSFSADQFGDHFKRAYQAMYAALEADPPPAPQSAAFDRRGNRLS
jgi:hypothetical protein